MKVADLNFSFSARGADDVERASNKAKGSLQSVERAQEDLTASSTTMASNVQSSANTLGFEFVSAAQDAKFGAAGVANQIPIMTEQFTQLQQKTGSTQGALSALVGALKGPAGVIGAITLLITFKDEITSFFQSFIGGAEEAAEKSKEFKKSVRSNAQALFDELRENPERAEQAISLLNERIDNLKVKLGEAFAADATDSIKRISEELQATRNALASVKAQTSDTQETFVALTELGLDPKLTDQLIKISEQSEDAKEDVKSLTDIVEEATIDTPDLQTDAPQAAGLAPFDISGVEKLNNALSITELRLREVKKRLDEGLVRTFETGFQRSISVLSGFIAGLRDAGSAAEALERIFRRVLANIIQQLIQAALKALFFKAIAASLGGGGGDAFTGVVSPGFSGSDILSRGGGVSQTGPAQVRGNTLSIPVGVVANANNRGQSSNNRLGR